VRNFSYGLTTSSKSPWNEEEQQKRHITQSLGSWFHWFWQGISATVKKLSCMERFLLLCFKLPEVKYYKTVTHIVRFLIKLLAPLLVWSSNLLTLNQCLHLERSVDREIIFTLRLSASETPVMSVGEIALLTKTEKMVRIREQEMRVRMRVCKDPWRVSHKASAMTNITLLRCWQTKGRLKRTERKGQATTDDWQRDTDGHWRTRWSLWWQISVVNISPAAAANPYT